MAMRVVRRGSLLASVIAAGTLAMPVAPALAQTTTGSSESGFTDLVPVVIVTIVAVLILLLVATLGYLYRRGRGMVTPLPDPDMVDDAHGGAHGETAGHLSEHAVAAHARGLHTDSLEQAEQLTEREEARTH